MTELLAHLVGDYVLQSHTMSLYKTSESKWALIHAFFYGLPFLFLVANPWQWLVIVGTHAIIDRFKLADRWCRFYGVGHPGLWWPKGGADFAAPAPFLGVWLTIIVDNTAHLAINHFALGYL